MKTPKGKWIRVSTAAELRGVKRQSIYWHIKEGNLKSMELDGTVFVDSAEVLEWEPKGAGEYKTRKKETRPRKKRAIQKASDINNQDGNSGGHRGEV